MKANDFAKILAGKLAANQTATGYQNFGHAHGLVMPKFWEGWHGHKPNRL